MISNGGQTKLTSQMRLRSMTPIPKHLHATAQKHNAWQHFRYWNSDHKCTWTHPQSKGGGHLEDVKAPAVTLQQVLWNLMCHALYIYMSACIHPFIFLSMSFVNSMLLKIASSFAVYMRYPQIVFANPFAYSGHRVDIDSLSRATCKSILPTPHPGHSQPHTGPTCCNLIVEPLCNSWGVMTPRDPSTL